jgi:hypothetical protein
VGGIRNERRSPSPAFDSFADHALNALHRMHDAINVAMCARNVKRKFRFRAQKEKIFLQRDARLMNSNDE